jgi:hypothetical protein
MYGSTPERRRSRTECLGARPRATRSIAGLRRIVATAFSADQIEALALLRAVDISHVRGTTDFFGHSYFISNPQVSADIVALLRYGLRPNEPGRPLKQVAGSFWRVPTQ